jgi:hypothetical protein
LPCLAFDADELALAMTSASPHDTAVMLGLLGQLFRASEAVQTNNLAYGGGAIAHDPNESVEPFTCEVRAVLCYQAGEDIEVDDEGTHSRASNDIE